MNTKKLWVSIITALVFTTLLFPRVISQEFGMQYITQAEEEVKYGKYGKAVQIMEDGLAELPKSEELKYEFCNLLTTIAEKLITIKKYAEALEYLTRAEALYPGDKRVAERKIFVVGELDKLKKQYEAKIAEPKPNPLVIVRDDAVNRETLRVIENNVNSLESAQGELSKFKSLASDNVRQLRRELRKQKVWFITVIVLLCIFATGVGLFYWVTELRFAKLAKDNVDEKKELVKILESQQQFFAQNISQLLTVQVVDRDVIASKDMINSSNRHVRARGVELMETELLKKGSVVNAVTALAPFLKDPDYRVRAKAARVVYRFNASIGMGVLENMLRSTDSREQVIAAFTLGEIGNIEASLLLLKLYNAVGRHGRTAVKQALQKVLDSTQSRMPSTLRNRIAGVISASDPKLSHHVARM